jgi:DNA-directed RNA polymerase specialized sigma24 family protein
MGNADDFDDFYLSSRRRLVVQTFALTGDLGASRTAVRDAYVAARHHWEKVGASPDPEAWVRPRAWATAQRLHTVRRWHRERGIDADQAATLEGLHGLADQRRRVVVLHLLAEMPTREIGREIGITLDRTETALSAGLTELADHLGCDPDALAGRLEDLAPATDQSRLPRPASVRRQGLRRRRNHAVIGSVLVAAVALAAGAFVSAAAPIKPLPKPGQLVSTAMLLSTADLAPVAGKTPWQLVSTGDNTRGTGINTTCQASAFADDAGLGTWVRTFSATGPPARRLVQTVEISNSPGAARAAYATTLGWYAGCRVARIQLVDAYALNGVGEQAEIVRMRIPAAQDRSFVVGVARTGALTTSAWMETTTADPADATTLALVLASSVRELCHSKVGGVCVQSAAVTPILPPSAGETPGMLAIADLPAIATVNQPWAGTDPVAATVNPAATTCDKAAFATSGAHGPVTRTYLIPQAKLPARFGISETIGRFPSTAAATAFVNLIESRMKGCPKHDLGSTISHAVIDAKGPSGSTYALWRLENQVSTSHQKVAFWMGIIRAGDYVAQVGLTPVAPYDVNATTFQALVVRARDRLLEISR